MTKRSKNCPLRFNRTSEFVRLSRAFVYRVFIKYCVFFRIFWKIPDSVFLWCQCVYTNQAGRKPAMQQNSQSSEKSQHFKEKTQYLMNTLYNLPVSIGQGIWDILYIYGPTLFCSLMLHVHIWVAFWFLCLQIHLYYISRFGSISIPDLFPCFYSIPPADLHPMSFFHIFSSSWLGPKVWLYAWPGVLGM